MPVKRYERKATGAELEEKRRVSALVEAKRRDPALQRQRAEKEEREHLERYEDVVSALEAIGIAPWRLKELLDGI